MGAIFQSYNWLTDSRNGITLRNPALNLDGGYGTIAIDGATYPLRFHVDSFNDRIAFGAQDKFSFAAP